MPTRYSRYTVAPPIASVGPVNQIKMFKVYMNSEKYIVLEIVDIVRYITVEIKITIIINYHCLDCQQVLECIMQYNREVNL